MNALLAQAGNYVTGLCRLMICQGSWSKASRVGRHYVISTDPWGSNNIYNQFTMMTTVDEIMNVSKAPQKAKD